ncbi:hypothetical protein [Actinoplanes sp. GCM10030250]|uniref:hypothetical protein n=1 Tax=Actinoplanes sp. GCM10030250 TaxID=3273376 RepID=UPI00361B45F9
MPENDGNKPKSVLRKVREHLTHDFAHVSGLIGLHVVALAILEHTPALPMIGLH